jgi:hypothetical protein
MFKQLLLILGNFVFFGLTQTLHAQEVLPMDGSTLNYTHVMFEIPFNPNANKYQITLKACNERGEGCKEIFTEKIRNRAILIREGIEFGKTYKWHYAQYHGKKKIYQSKDFLFYVGSNQLLDTNLQKIVFTKPYKGKQKDILIIDGLKLITDLSGKPILYLNYKSDHSVRDINLTPQGTLTLVDNRFGEVKELKLNGEMLWIGAGKYENTEGRDDKYHHEFEKVNPNFYLAAGKKKVGNLDETDNLQDVPPETLCETIIGFDKEANEIWRFNLLSELKRQYNISPDANMFNPTRLGHLNGMAVDTNANIVYASFKTFNTVMKIDMASNRILYQYGLKKINFLDSLEEGLSFEQQHAPIFNWKGNLLIFNNGNEKTGSGISELRVGENLSAQNELVKNIYFKDYLPKDYYAVQMGSVQQTGKNKYLICMGSVPHYFEIDTKKKKLLWQAYTYQNYRYQEGGKIWKPVFSYRIRQYPSLYPYYFTADLITKKSRTQIKVCNVGSETDSYYLIDAETGKSLNIFLKDIKSGKSKKIKISHKGPFYVVSTQSAEQKLINQP